MSNDQLTKDLTIQLLATLKRCDKLEAEVNDLKAYEADIRRSYEASIAAMEQTIKDHVRTIAQLSVQLPEL